MAPTETGLQSDGLKVALRAAVAGKPAELERMLARLGAATASPNLRLAAAFGAEMAAWPAPVAPLLARLADDDAAPDTDRVFLPIAAAHGFSACLRLARDEESAWAALANLAADERAPVRLGTCDALVAFSTRAGGADQLVARATSWLDDDDRPWRLGVAAVIADVLGDRRVLGTVRQGAALLAYLSRLLDEIAAAPRSAERSDARRRLTRSLPPLLSQVVSMAAGGPEAARWFQQECTRAAHPHVRDILSDVIVHLGTSSRGVAASVVGELRRSLEASAKPLRDPSRLRPGMGRGKASRRTR